MGGFRSGRPRQHVTVEECRVLDVNALNRRDHLPRPPKDETWVQVQVRDGDDWQTVTQYIKVERRPCHFGGTRHYFRCWCDRPAVKLYQRSSYGFYRCRRCYKLVYQSQREDACDRAFRAAAKIKRRLGGDPDYFAPFPPKPKDMWRKTYERSCHQYLEIEAHAETAFDIQFEAIMRWGQPPLWFR
jgi:hypothetical protein